MAVIETVQKSHDQLHPLYPEGVAVTETVQKSHDPGRPMASIQIISEELRVTKTQRVWRLLRRFRRRLKMGRLPLVGLELFQFWEAPNIFSSSEIGKLVHAHFFSSYDHAYLGRDVGFMSGITWSSIWHEHRRWETNSTVLHKCHVV